MEDFDYWSEKAKETTTTIVVQDQVEGTFTIVHGTDLTDCLQHLGIKVNSNLDINDFIEDFNEKNVGKMFIALPSITKTDKLKKR